MLTLESLRGPHTGRWLSLALLLTLHGVLWLELSHPLARPLLLVHLGFFLIWQPLWRREARLPLPRALLILGFSLLALFLMGEWLLAFWIAGLFSLVGARAFTFQSRWVRIYYLLMMAYLLAVLLLFLPPHLFGLGDLHQVTHDLLNYGLPLLLVLMLLLPVEEEQAQMPRAVDFFYVILLFMLVGVLVLGTLAFMTLKQVDYLSALLGTLAFMAAALFILGVLWRPQSSFGGLRAGFSRYLLSIGTPLESWLQQLAGDAQQHSTPQAFLQSASAHLTEMPWVSGLAWVADEGHGMLGTPTPNRIDLAERDLAITLFLRTTVAPSVLLHMRLLVSVLGYFYQAKRRERQLRDLARQQAIYETGARLVHDLKNMLQSLFALTSIAQQETDKARPILQQQLPELTRRIEILLGKLKVPQDEMEGAEIALSDWWDRLYGRYRHRELSWQLHGESAAGIPAGMFDCVADNLIENAANKRLREPDVRITISLDADARTFRVRDNGSAVPETRAQSLTHTVVPSEDGLGVGLYQAARWAQQSGYRLHLAENRDGSVCFELRPETSPAGADGSDDGAGR